MKKTDTAKQPAAPEAPQTDAVEPIEPAESSDAADQNPAVKDAADAADTSSADIAPVVEAVAEEVEHAAVEAISEHVEEVVQEQAMGLCSKIAEAARSAARAGDMQTHATLAGIEGKLGELKHFLADKLDVVEGDIAEAIKSLHFHL